MSEAWAGARPVSVPVRVSREVLHGSTVDRGAFQRAINQEMRRVARRAEWDMLAQMRIGPIIGERYDAAVWAVLERRAIDGTAPVKDAFRAWAFDAWRDALRPEPDAG